MVTITRHFKRKHYARDGKYIGMFGPVEAIRPVRVGDKTEIRQIPVMEKVSREDVSFVKAADGRSMRRIVETKEVELQVHDEMPLVDENGKPVVEGGRPVLVKVPRMREEVVVIGGIYENQAVIEEVIPEGAIEIPAPPQIEGYEWDGRAWIPLSR